MPKQVANIAKGKKALRVKRKKRRITSVETTIHIRRHVRNCVNHKKTPRAIKAIRNVARRLFKINTVKMDHDLNRFVWTRGVKRPPSRVRVKFTLTRLSAKGNRPCVKVEHVPVTSFHGLRTRTTIGRK